MAPDDPSPRDAAGPAGTHLDNRGLEPPMPMVRTLEAYERLAPGERLTIHNDRVPVYLLPQLRERGARYHVDERPEGDAIVVIERPPAGDADAGT